MKKSITILEDDRDIREICTLIFHEEGYAVNSFENITALTKRNPEASTDLFLLDIQLPDGNGLELCQKLKANADYGKVPIIMMSAQIGKARMMDSCKADGFIEKPFDINKLINMVALLLH